MLQRLRSEGDRVGVMMITAARERTTMRGKLDGGAAYLINPLSFRSYGRNWKPSGHACTLKSAAGVGHSLVDSLRGCPITRPQRPVLPKVLGEETGWLVFGAVRAAGELGAS